MSVDALRPSSVSGRPAKFPVVAGARFGRLTVVQRLPVVFGDSGNRGTRKYLAECVCDCGKTKAVNTVLLRNGKAKSCGCIRTEMLVERNHRMATHRMHSTPEYHSWRSMKKRCGDPNNKDYHNYGARGISVCPQWLNSFEQFLADMGRKPGSGYTLDRIDSNGNYVPENCRWATAVQQAQNRRKRECSTLTSCVTTSLGQH